jgi:hypothetical protein
MFNLFKFALRRARQHWQLLFTLSVGVLLAAALLASGPLLVDRLIETGLRLTIQNSSLLDGNLLLATSVPANEPGFQQLDQRLKTLIVHTLGQHQQQVTVSAKSPWLYPWVSSQVSTSQRVNLVYYEDIQEHADILAGNWPAEPGTEPGVMRVVVGEGMARAFALHVGDRLALSPNTSANTPQLWLQVTGIVHPRNPHDPYWSGELGPFSSMQTAGGTSQYQAIVPLDIFFTKTKTLFPDSSLELNWYVSLDPQSFTAADIEPFQAQLAKLATQLAIFHPPVKLETGMPGVLKKFQAQFETIRLPVYILIAEILLLVLYYVSMVAELSTRQMEREFATMYSRGISTWQIARAHLLEILVILAITFSIGPWLGAGLVRILSWVGPLSNVAQPGEVFNLGRNVWIATGVGTLVCLASLVFPLGPALRRSIVAYQQIITRDTRLPWWQRYYLDVFVLCIGLVLMWRLNQYGEMLVGEPGGAQLDWLLLLSPLALSVGAATLFLRLFPFFLEILASFAARGRGLLGALALWQSARNPAHVSRLVLLLTLAVSLGILSTGLDLTLDQSEFDRASYLAGKDLRLSAPGAVPLRDVQSMPGVKRLSAVWRGQGTLSSGSLPSTFDLLAIEPGSFSKVAIFRRDFADQNMATLLAHLSVDKGGNPSLLPLPGQPARFGIWLWAQPDNKAELDSDNRWIDGDSDVERVGVTAKFQTAQGELFTTQLKRMNVDGRNGPTVKRFTLKTTLDGRDFNLGIHIRPDNGGWYYLDSALPELPPSSYPLSLQSLWFQNQATRLGKPIAKAISLVADDFTVVDAVTQKTHIVEDFESLNRIVFLITMNGSRYVGIFSSVTDRVSHSGTWGQSITMNYAPPMQVYPLRLRRTWTQEPLPALASGAFLDTTKAKIGDVVHASINDVGINLRIAGALRYFPTMYNQSQNGYLVTSRDLLLPILNNVQVTPINPNEVFVDSGGNLSLDSLLAIMPLTSQGWSAENVRKTFMANPLALGLRSIAFFGFILTTLLSLLGFSTHFYMSIRLRETLFGVMRALGISARQLYFWMVLEQAILILASLILGTALGLLLNQITLPRLPVTLGDAQSIPPFVPQTDWRAIGLLYLGLLLAFLVVIALVTAFVWRARLERILRTGEES